MLKNICMASAKAPAELLRVAGIGKNKMNKYGQAILGVMGE